MKTRSMCFLLLTLLALLHGTSLHGQWWGGCRDALGTPVMDYPKYDLQDIAVSTIANGRPVIFYNPNVVVSVSQSTRRFFYMHECGHHALGQIVSGQYIPYASEQAADCWAAQTLVQMGAFSYEDLRNVQRDVANTPGDWSHLPGPQRALNLVSCVQQGSPGGNGGTDAGGGRCRVVTVYRTITEYATRYVQQQIPCQHPVCGPYGCGPAHAFDVVMVPQQVPVQRNVPVQQTVCN
jgi:hypothetical protein